MDESAFLSSLSMPSLPTDLFEPQRSATQPANTPSNPPAWQFINPLLDGDDPPPISSPPTEAPLPVTEIGVVITETVTTETVPPAGNTDIDDMAIQQSTVDEIFGFELEIPLFNPLLD